MSDGRLGSRGLFAKYVGSLVAVVTLVLVVNGVIDIWFSYQSSREALERIQREKAAAAARRVEQFVIDIERLVGWTTDPQWTAMPPEQRRLDFIRLTTRVRAVMELVQIDGNGHEQLKVSRLAMDVTGSQADWTADPRFKEIQDKPVWFSPVYWRKESEPYMSMSLARKGKRSGATVAEVNLKLILDVVSAIKAGKAGYTYVVDRDGKLIAHPDISLVLRATDMSHLDHVRAALQVGKEGGDPAPPAAIGANLDGRNVLSVAAPIPALGWLVFVELPLREALQPLYTSLIQTAALLALGLVLAATVAWMLARHMVVPIRALTAGSDRLGSGDLGHRIDVRTGDEIETLAAGFNRMAEQLEKSYADLESKVEARTHELVEKSHQLELASQHKSQFLANMSHELRTPLNAVLGYAELLCDGIYGPLPDKAHGVLERVQSNGRHLLGLINDVLDLSKIEAGQLKLSLDAYAMSGVVQTVVAATESLANAKRLKLRATIGEGLPTGVGDERRLTQVLLNLVGNAIKFTDQGDVEIAAKAADGRFEIAVSDTGPGIAPEDQARIFEEFQQVDNVNTRKKGGTGLGLAISRRIVEMHGGTMTVDSEVGRGSTFRVVVPVRVEKQQAAA